MVFKNHNEHVEINEQKIHQELRKIFHETIKLDVKLFVSFDSHAPLIAYLVALIRFMTINMFQWQFQSHYGLTL